MRPGRGHGPDDRLLRRRDCEYEIFLSVEEAVETPGIRGGFGSIDEFIARGQTVLQRRKACAGRSLELHARQVFLEEGLRESEHFDHDVESEPGRRPDFRFRRSPATSIRRTPTIGFGCWPRKPPAATGGGRHSTRRTEFLPSTCSPFWRGVSESQFREVKESGVQLVVPSRLWTHYPAVVRRELVSLRDFTAGVGQLRG